MGLAVAGVCLGIRMYRADAKLPTDLAVALEVGATRVSAAGSAVDRLGMRFAPLVLRLMGPKRVDAKRRRIDMAGNPGGLTIDRYAARRAVYGVFGLVLGLVFLTNGSPLFGLLTLAFGAVAADALIWQAIRERREVIDRTLPDFLDVLAVVVSAGLGFRQALDRVAERYEGPWADELRITLRQMDMGVSRRQAFDDLRRRNASEQVAQFVSALQQGEELGSPIADTLIQIATDMRRTDAQNSRRRAAKTIPKATMVTLVFMLPATMILIAAGMFLGSGSDFGSILDR
ncbi:type II secretion system F family protein [Streptomyces sp. SID335]|nr:type II secretion system F family protein [Streptomyces sp. SID335]MYZ18572.1 type II secretion system F family protein [Streptomyces sp. SID337]NDZ90573.1 type II secretion system F family protein [Streptomyces sp. SID10115]NDZ98565.1 type II secretion system F family protein [Streptomyces sp. SID10116]NEB44146.1 type II secretion system F family protein [Streptomyces sp. SID339]